MKPAEQKPYLKIGDVARLVGVSPSVIRSWESLGLTRPHRTASKYRLYAPEDVKLLKRARFLRKVRGLNAPAIVQLLKRDGLLRSSSNGASSAIGTRLRQLRSRRGLSLAQVAKAVGISVGFLSALERSHMSASVSTLRKLARFYKTNILDFFDPAESNIRLVSPDKRKVKSTIHWVSAKHAVDAEVRLYEHLFKAEDPEDVPAGLDWKANLNPNSLEVVAGAKVEPSLRDATAGEKYQFERIGYFSVDPDSKPGKPVFNRAVSLKDSWAKEAQKAPKK